MLSPHGARRAAQGGGVVVDSGLKLTHPVEDPAAPHRRLLVARLERQHRGEVGQGLGQLVARGIRAPAAEEQPDVAGRPVQRRRQLGDAVWHARGDSLRDQRGLALPLRPLPPSRHPFPQASGRDPFTSPYFASTSTPTRSPTPPSHPKLRQNFRDIRRESVRLRTRLFKA